MVEAIGRQSQVSRRADNTVNSGPEFWGLRALEDVPVMTQNQANFEVYEGDINERDTDRAYERTNQVNVLCRPSGQPPSGRDVIPTCVKVEGNVPQGAAYRNNIYHLPVSGDMTSFVLDLFNNRANDETRLRLNAMLRKMVMLVPTRTLTWGVQTTGDFNVANAVRIRNGPFATEQILVKCHIYIRWQSRLVDALNYFRSDPSAPFNPPDNTSEYRRWKTMGSERGDLDANGRITGESQNRIEVGINHLVIVLNPQTDGTIRIEEVYLDGDRMVLE